jgi:hypothetical protein
LKLNIKESKNQKLNQTNGEFGASGICALRAALIALAISGMRPIRLDITLAHDSV